MFTKLCAVITAIGAVHGSVQWYAKTDYMAETLGSQPTMAIQTVVGLSAMGLMVGVFKAGKGK
ncbi:MAG: hypothetical protein AAGD14_06710 [Planctomycetota bacterium]